MHLATKEVCNSTLQCIRLCSYVVSSLNWLHASWSSQIEASIPAHWHHRLPIEQPQSTYKPSKWVNWERSIITLMLDFIFWLCTRGARVLKDIHGFIAISRLWLLLTSDNGNYPIKIMNDAPTNKNWKLMKWKMVRAPFLKAAAP